ncbi:hypothetical protein Y032_0563g3512 [Ancylostoma ceylanicum]|uniref:Uncharacterized protein n=1 Tax=Ancylostoma ceylanicum TaxID=53326 RepID=A0A016WPL7_9BILA|nr:hypothetical protein Y032_0563g3512 [Ancylostoma ceylanicum]
MCGVNHVMVSVSSFYDSNLSNSHSVLDPDPFEFNNDEKPVKMGDESSKQYNELVICSSSPQPLRKESRTLAVDGIEMSTEEEERLELGAVDSHVVEEEENV